MPGNSDRLKTRTAKKREEWFIKNFSNIFLKLIAYLMHKFLRRSVCFMRA